MAAELLSGWRSPFYHSPGSRGGARPLHFLSAGEMRGVPSLASFRPTNFRPHDGGGELVSLGGGADSAEARRGPMAQSEAGTCGR